MPDGAVSSSNTNTTTSNTAAEVKTLEYQTCVICMEDLPGNELRQHNACDCVICTPCLGLFTFLTADCLLVNEYLVCTIFLTKIISLVNIERTIEHHQTTADILPKVCAHFSVFFFSNFVCT